MKHSWQNIEGTEVLLNCYDGKTPLAYINCVNGAFIVNVPFSKINIDLKDISNGWRFETKSSAKRAAEKEVQRRIDEFISPGN